MTQQEVRNGLVNVEYNLNTSRINRAYWQARRKAYLKLLIDLQLREFKS